MSLFSWFKNLFKSAPREERKADADPKDGFIVRTEKTSLVSVPEVAPKEHYISVDGKKRIWGASCSSADEAMFDGYISYSNENIPNRAKALTVIPCTEELHKMCQENDSMTIKWKKVDGVAHFNGLKKQ